MWIRKSDKGVGPWATSEDAKEPKDNQVIIRPSRLLGPRTRANRNKQAMLFEELNFLG